MQVTIQPQNIDLNIQAPPSKSLTQRALAAALIRKGNSYISNAGISNDEKAALNIIQSLGAKIQIQSGFELMIESNGIHPVNNIHCGESGLSARMFTPIIATTSNPTTITGAGSLLKRPMHFFDEVLPQLGIECTSKNGALPLQLNGAFTPKNIKIDGSISSQYLTGLLMAYSAVDAKDVTITVNNLSSKPYIDLTLQVLSDFGLKIPINNNYQSFYFPSRIHTPAPTDIHYKIEGDWSGAAFWLVAGAIAGNVHITEINVQSSQADKAILQTLMECGVRMSITDNSIEIGKCPLQPFHIDATDCPDLVPPLAVLAAYCNGKSFIEGIDRLKHKESDRAVALQQELGKMGINIHIEDNVMKIAGGGKIKGAVVDSHNDHRIAMACAVAALQAEGNTIIECAEAVDKSYVDFFSHFKK